jgi:hypothetical protein
MGDDYGYDPYLDRDDKNNRLSVHPNPDHPTRVAARQAGQSTLSAALHRQGGHGSRLLSKSPRGIESVLRQLEDRGVLVFMSGRQRFSYAAIGLRSGRWFITGAGQFYGKNEFTRDEFIEVLMHDEVAEIWTSVRFEQVH